MQKSCQKQTKGAKRALKPLQKTTKAEQSK